MGDYNVNTLNELNMSTTQMLDFPTKKYTFYYSRLIKLFISQF